ncbi:MAG: GNAT family N-acetyltransferase [Candidatus Nanohalobium sp.]
MEAEFDYSSEGFYPEKIETENMTLRKASTENYDASEVLKFMRTQGVEEAFKTYPYEVPDSEDKALGFIEKREYENKEGNNFTYLIGLDESSNPFDGEIIIKTEGKTAELGFWLTSDYWGNAYASEAAKAVIEMLFEDKSFEKIEVQTTESNEKAQRATEKFILPLGGKSLGKRQTTMGAEAEYSDSDEEITVVEYELERENYSP